MIERFYKLKDYVEILISSCDQINGLDNKKKDKIRKLDLNRNEGSIVEILIKILRPFYEATRLLSRTKYPTLSSCVIVYKLLSSFLNKEDSNSEYFQILKEILLENLEFHLDFKIILEQSKLIKVMFYFVN